MEAVVALLEILSKFATDPTIFRYKVVKYTLWVLVSLLALGAILGLCY